MGTNRTRTAIYLSLVVGLVACGGGGGGGGGSGNEQPAFGDDFDGSFTLYGTNPASSSFGTTFDDTFPADFVDGRATTNNVATRFDYPLGSGTSGCRFERGAVDSCVEQADGRVLVLCNAAGDDEPAIVGISDERSATGFDDSSLAALRTAADARGPTGLRLQALTCQGTLDTGNTVTVRPTSDGSILQVSGGQSGSIPGPTADQLFSAGQTVGNPATARLGSRAFTYVEGGTTTYYVVNFGATETGGGFTPFVFVSVN